jgi:hypothetical protein
MRVARSAFVLAFCFGMTPQAVASAQLLVSSGGPSEAGHAGRMTLRPPFPFPEEFDVDVEPDAVVRTFGRRGFVVSRASGTVQVLHAETGQIVDTIELGTGSEPQDIAVVSKSIAYVTRKNATRLLRLNPSTGASAESTDLSAFADEDGIPDLGMMAVHRGRVFVQIRRQNFDHVPPFVPPALLAVVDGATGALIDADPTTAGVQAIELAGTAAKHKMQIVGRRLYVGATGGEFDEGGIEAVDLRGLRSEGLVIRELDGTSGADLGPFAFTSPRGGWLAFTTDLTPSSHVVPFTLEGGVVPTPAIYTVVDYLMPHIVAAKGKLFLPTASAAANGILVFDAKTGAQLTPEPVATPAAPTDLEILR